MCVSLSRLATCASIIGNMRKRSASSINNQQSQPYAFCDFDVTNTMTLTNPSEYIMSNTSRLSQSPAGPGFTFRKHDKYVITIYICSILLYVQSIPFGTACNAQSIRSNKCLKVAFKNKLKLQVCCRTSMQHYTNDARLQVEHSNMLSRG